MFSSCGRYFQVTADCWVDLCNDLACGRVTYGARLLGMPLSAFRTRMSGDPHLRGDGRRKPKYCFGIGPFTGAYWPRPRQIQHILQCLAHRELAVQTTRGGGSAVCEQQRARQTRYARLLVHAGSAGESANRQIEFALGSVCNAANRGVCPLGYQQGGAVVDALCVSLHTNHG